MSYTFDVFQNALWSENCKFILFRRSTSSTLVTKVCECVLLESEILARLQEDRILIRVSCDNGNII
jgi:hypothetical protein